MISEQLSQSSVELAQSVIREMSEGKRSTGIEWGTPVTKGEALIKEMIGTDDGSREFVEKLSYDIYKGREDTPLLYKDLYSTKVNSGFPRVFTETNFGPVQVVFLEKVEGGEVVFGTLGPEEEKVVRIATYSAGIEYTEDMVEYNEYWRLSDVSSAYGEAYNKLLNHLHLSPIISGTYETTGASLTAQKAAQEDDTAQLIAYDTDLPTTLRNALTVLPRGTKMLINSADTYLIEDAIASSMYADTTPSVVKRKLSSASFIEYDGDEIEVGGKTYEYAGVTSGEAYLIVPKKQLREYIKHDLRVDASDGDLSRLVVDQIVGRARRGVFAALAGKFGVIKIELEA